MKLRTLGRDEQGALLELLDGWDLPDGWSSRDFFKRAFGHDPTFNVDQIWVAAEGDRLHGCVQILPRRLRVLGHAVPCGGLARLYTRHASRGSGIASALLDRALRDMTERGMELALLFSPNGDYYAARGWQSWTRQRTVLRADASSTGQPHAYRIESFEQERDLAAVQAIHSAYSATRNGTVVRDVSLWEASLVLAGNPDEDFRVAREEGGDGRLLAYARATLLSEVFTVTELARLDEGAAALAALMRDVLTARDNDPLAPPGRSSRELRSLALLPTFDDLAFTVALENGGMRADMLEDPSAMLRCIDPEALARRLHVTLLPDEVGADFLRRLLPSDSFVFWPADRF